VFTDDQSRGQRMSGIKKLFLIILGALSALLIVGQLVMGQLIVSGRHEPALLKSHQHSGYLTVVVVLAYVVVSLATFVSLPTRNEPGR
jgi:hypothetical protein